MCDLTAKRKSTCIGNTGNWLKPVKLSRYELRIPSSKSYWEERVNKIEQRYKRVSYPFHIPPIASLTPSPGSQLPDDIKFKISPPTPMHTVQQSIVEAKIGRETEIKPSESGEKHKLPSALPQKAVGFVEKEKSKEIKIYSKKSCPRHKNAAPTKVFDDDILKCLKKFKSSVPNLPSIKKETKPYTNRQAIRSRSAASFMGSQKSTNIDDEVRKKITKPPKLGTASLLPSFAKAVSIDSLAGIRESLDSDESPKVETETHKEKRDFLRVPNLSFVSSHPSFRKLSHSDSFEEERLGTQDISVTSEEQYMRAKKSLKPEKKVLVSKEETIEKDKKSSKTKKLKSSKVTKTDIKLTRTKSYYERKYALKALDFLTKHRHPELKQVIRELLSTNVSLPISNEESDTENHKSSISQSCEEDLDDINVKEIREKLKELATKYLGPNQIPKSLTGILEITESITMRSSSRSTSGESPNFINDTIAAPSAEILKKIPEGKIFQRPYIDKCYACLQKPFLGEKKVHRELPLTIIKSVIENPPDFGNVSSSSSSCSTIKEIINQLNCDISDDDSFDTLQFDELPLDSTDHPLRDNEPRDQIKVSFDESNLSPTPKTASSLTTSDKSVSESIHHLKSKSLSMQSSDRSKTSTPSNQSSDSEEARPQEEGKAPSSKYKVPCHVPTVWCPSLEPLKALKNKKYMSLRQRAAALVVKSSESGGSDSQDENLPAGKSDQKDKDTTDKDDKGTKARKEKKEKKKKPLLRMKTVAEKLIASTAAVEEIKEKPVLKRSKTTFDLTTMEDSDESSGEEEISAVIEKTPKEEKEEPLPLAEVILKHRARSPPPPIMPPEEVAEIIKSYLQKDEFDPSELLGKLSEEFLERLKCRLKSADNVEEKNCLKLGLNLFKTLVDSRRYLNPELFDPNLEFSQNQPPLSNTRQLRRAIPPTTFELVAPILGMPLFSRSRGRRVRTIHQDEKSELTLDLIVHPPTENEESYHRHNGFNPYAKFLRKPRRKAVVWRPLREEDLRGWDPERTLQMRAARLMDKICQEFCEWSKKLGGTEQVIDEDTLKDMFEINFTSEACKAMQVVLKEMPTVPLAVVNTRGCYEAAQLEATRRRIYRDRKVEQIPARTHAFGRSLPSHLRFRPPLENNTDKWLICDKIPKDLENMDVVWEGIVHTDSVRAFVEFLEKNTKIASPKLLKKLQERLKQSAKAKMYDGAGSEATSKFRN